MKNTIQKIWENKVQILEGITNNIFKKENVEIIAKHRNDICLDCDSLDTIGTDCAVPGTQPCCRECGCSKAIKIRSLSAECPLGKWEAIITQEQEDKLIIV